MSSITSLTLEANSLGDEGVEALSIGLRKSTSLATLNLADNGIGPTGATALASALAVSASLTSVTTARNEIGDGASQLSAAVLANAKIEKFNGIPIMEMRTDSHTTELNLNSNGMGAAGAMVVAALLPAMSSITSIDLSFNSIGSRGATALAPAREPHLASPRAGPASRNGVGLESKTGSRRGGVTYGCKGRPPLNGCKRYRGGWIF